MNIATNVRKTMQQHDDRREQAEQLRGALLDRRELGLAVVLDGDAFGLDRLANGVLDSDDRLAVLVVDRLGRTAPRRRRCARLRRTCRSLNGSPTLSSPALSRSA